MKNKIKPKTKKHNELLLKKIILENKIESGISPVAVNFLPTAKIKPITPEIVHGLRPKKNPKEMTPKQVKDVELWLSQCSIGVRILDTGTKMLKHLEVLDGRDAIFDMTHGFKKLWNHYVGDSEYKKKEQQFEDFIFTFLTMTDEQQKRTIKFAESIINKKY